MGLMRRVWAGAEAKLRSSVKVIAAEAEGISFLASGGVVGWDGGGGGDYAEDDAGAGEEWGEFFLFEIDEVDVEWGGMLVMVAAFLMVGVPGGGGAN